MNPLFWFVWRDICRHVPDPATRWIALVRWTESVFGEGSWMATRAMEYGAGRLLDG